MATTGDFTLAIDTPAPLATGFDTMHGTDWGYLYTIAWPPLQLTFDIDASSTGGNPASAIGIFRNGILVPDCLGAVPSSGWR